MLRSRLFRAQGGLTVVEFAAAGALPPQRYVPHRRGAAAKQRSSDSPRRYPTPSSSATIAAGSTARVRISNRLDALVAQIRAAIRPA
jgi:hypothetical protein